ncbi:MAG TPA: hypothetical protein DEU03_10965 [Bacillus sp. (in: Bacteria)]|jgi:hypothetical protein|uniref:DNA mismatch repair protein MutT n=4 Tax=Bacillus cereus group TaxID=86661 RepID=A0A9X6VZB5_BACCE|nr:MULTISPECIES: hypothetical protein [Bacillus cereus group]EEL65554.1 hypothetical protein bcere0025_17340 [Bacillus cereus F65185]EEM53883.1 hypothetical protein bthur0006_17620 [Bacillus thuringiensis serovar kurstaki str. T03a001]OTW66718.1 hypothetical protein BK701_07825 [Bacillus thuringiensis serovar amagiensis]OTW78147.1 hypothetical protein BK713_23945 [Bacillus thuringiensis serovar jinghongiensis]OTX11351.1 hypothetical protein BK715_31075 [Bacillus thuringiensis serovar japonensi
MRSFIGIKRGGIFVRNIIDDPIQKNIELYYAFIQFVSMITLQKVSAIETRKNELKNQMKNAGQKNPYYV